jgi:hypothetical protein
MARSIVRSNTKEAPQISISKPPDIVERRLRRVGAWLLLYLSLQAELGLAWDRNWHDFIGRDQFFTPPHIMLYSGVGGAGLIALIIVLADTLRYRHKKAGVDDSSTVRILRFFHAPLGYILLGFGALTDLAAAPLDNYWHLLYGIDVTLWSPFHIMGTIGGIMEGLGIIYVFASEVVIERQSAYPPRRFLGFSGLEWGTLILLSALMNLTIPAVTAFIPVTLGTLQIVTYPLPLALAGGFSLLCAVQFTHKPGSATVTALLVWLQAVFTMSFVPVALHVAVARLGLTYRFPDRVPGFNFTLALLPLLFLISALVIDSAAYVYRRQDRIKAELNALPKAWVFWAFIALPALLIPPLVLHILKGIPALQPLPAGLEVFEPQWSAMLLALPFALLVGALAGQCGTVFGDIWRWNKS